MSTYALDLGGKPGDYSIVVDENGAPADLARALHAAFDELRIKDISHVTVLNAEALEGGRVEITAVCSITPPITPPTTSPGGTA